MTRHKHLQIDELDGVAVAHFRDPLPKGDLEVHELNQELDHLAVARHGGKVVIDFATVEFLASETLGKVIALQQKLKAGGGALRLCNLADGILEVFRISRLDQILAIKRDLAEAVASLQAA